MFIKRGLVREYLKYIVPTMLTFTLVSIYSIVDGVFVGHAVGDAGLAGVNVAYPLVQLSERERMLRGLDWRPHLRPRRKSDVTTLSRRPSAREEMLS